MRAVVVIMNFAVFDKYAFLYFLYHSSKIYLHKTISYLFEVFLFDKVVLTPMNFALSGVAGGVADAELEVVWIFLQQFFDKRALAII